MVSGFFFVFSTHNECVMRNVESNSLCWVNFTVLLGFDSDQFRKNCVNVTKNESTLNHHCRKCNFEIVLFLFFNLLYTVVSSYFVELCCSVYFLFSNSQMHDINYRLNCFRSLSCFFLLLSFACFQWLDFLVFQLFLSLSRIITVTVVDIYVHYSRMPIDFVMTMLRDSNESSSRYFVNL